MATDFKPGDVERPPDAPDLLKENARLREALEYYGDGKPGEFYVVDDKGERLTDYYNVGEKARTALRSPGGEEEG